MNVGDNFTHNGVSYTVDRVLPDGRVMASTTEAVAPPKLVINPNDITP